MRVKIKNPDTQQPLEFGKKYEIVVFAASFWFEFVFTRKRHLYLMCVGPSGNHGATKVSKRNVKRLINSSVTQWVFEIE